MTNLTIKS